MSSIGWIGSLLLAFCGAPSAWSAFRRKRSHVPWNLLIPWGLGEILVFIYTAGKLGWDPLLVNYAANLLFIGIISYYKVKFLKKRSSASKP